MKLEIETAPGYMGKGITNGLAGWASVDLSWLVRRSTEELKLVNN